MNSSNAASSPSVDQAATEPSSGALGDVKKIVISNHPTAASEPAKKNEKAAKNNGNAGEKRANAGDVPAPTPDLAEQYPEVNTVPNMPDIGVPDMPRPGKRGLRRFGGTTVRNLPDGTQIMTLPDGTRVVTRPNGTKRIFGPGQKIERRKG